MRTTPRKLVLLHRLSSGLLPQRRSRFLGGSDAAPWSKAFGRDAAAARATGRPRARLFTCPTCGEGGERPDAPGKPHLLWACFPGVPRVHRGWYCTETPARRDSRGVQGAVSPDGACRPGLLARFREVREVRGTTDVMLGVGGDTAVTLWQRTAVGCETERDRLLPSPGSRVSAFLLRQLVTF